MDPPRAASPQLLRPSGAARPRALAGPGARDAAVLQVIAAVAFITPADGFVDLTRIGTTSVTNLAGYAALALALLRMPAILRRMPAAFWAWTVAVGLGTAVGGLTAMSGGGDFGRPVITLWQMMGLWALVIYGAADPRRGETVIKAFLGGMSLVIGLYLVLHTVGYGVGETAERVVTVAGYRSNHAGANAALTLLLIVGTWRLWGPSLRWVFGLAAAPACMYVVMLTNSRGAFVTLAAGLLVFLVPSRRRTRYRPVQYAAVFAGALGVLVLVVGMHRTEQLIDRQVQRWQLSGPHAISQLTTKRTDILSKGLDMAADQPLGYGFGNAERVLARRMHRFDPMGTHNNYLRMLLGGGVLAFLLYLAGHGLLLRGALLARRRAGAAWVLAVLLALQVLFLTSDSDAKETWIFLGIVTGAIVRARTAGARAPAPARPAAAGT